MKTLTEAQKKSFEENGYLVIDTGIADAVLDQVIEDLSGYWGDVKPEGVSHADEHRIQSAWKISESINHLAICPRILDILSELYAKKPLPFQTLNFPIGTEQAAHADSIHFNSEPFGMMCGVWVALEDIGRDQGPLIYYPGSHRMAEMNYRDVGLEPGLVNYPDYETHLQGLIRKEKLEPVYGLLKKGEALIWAANLLHGGSIQNDKTLTRNSQVTHYYFDGCKYWRPSHSHSNVTIMNLTGFLIRGTARGFQST
ncbi:MAG: phytanoyl-CoA dioxygenase family protein [Opitutaceae bacterium]|nr:phytanoyl-CoA dioxygenase family protein [Opitutaceae bacterium]